MNFQWTINFEKRMISQYCHLVNSSIFGQIPSSTNGGIQLNKHKELVYKELTVLWRRRKDKGQQQSNAFSHSEERKTVMPIVERKLTGERKFSKRTLST